MPAPSDIDPSRPIWALHLTTDEASTVRAALEGRLNEPGRTAKARELAGRVISRLHTLPLDQPPTLPAAASATGSIRHRGKPMGYRFRFDHADYDGPQEFTVEAITPVIGRIFDMALEIFEDSGDGSCDIAVVEAPATHCELDLLEWGNVNLCLGHDDAAARLAYLKGDTPLYAGWQSRYAVRTEYDPDDPGRVHVEVIVAGETTYSLTLSEFAHFKAAINTFNESEPQRVRRAPELRTR